MSLFTGLSLGLLFSYYLTHVSTQDQMGTSTQTTLRESEESQLWADLKHMQTMSSALPIPPSTRSTLFSTRTFERSEHGHVWDRFPETSPTTRSSTYLFSARSESFKKLTNTTTKSTTFRFTKKQRKMSEKLLRSMKSYREPNSRMVIFDD